MAFSITKQFARRLEFFELLIIKQKPPDTDRTNDIYYMLLSNIDAKDFEEPH